MLRLIAAVVLGIFPTAAFCATYMFDVVVTESMDLDPSPDPFIPPYDLPDVGTTGTITVNVLGTVFDGSTAIPDPDADLSSLIEVKAEIGDLTSELTEPSIIPSILDASFRVSNGEFSDIDVFVPTVPTSAALAGGFVFIPPAGTAPPTSLTDIKSIFDDPLTAVTFSFNGDIDGEFVSFVASTPDALPPIPLPAGGLLLLSGLTVLGFVHKRRNHEKK